MSKPIRVAVEAPATSANLGPGFDVLALALRGPVDRLEVVLEDGRGGLSLEVESHWPVATSVAKNAAGAVARAIAKDYGLESRIKMKLVKGVQVGVGLGSSAASSVCAVKGVSACFGLKLSTSEAIAYAAKGEEVSSGAGHFDNVSACLLGGVVVVRTPGGVDVSRVKPAPSIGLCVATPAVPLPERKTEFARSLLPRRVALVEMSENASLAASLVLGFERGDAELIGKGMHDRVVEPARSGMIPGYLAVREGALKAGAAGVCISGAGPSLLAVYDKRRVSGRNVLRAMKEGFTAVGVPSTGFESEVGEGAMVIASNRG